jgi:hypothetical protein
MATAAPLEIIRNAIGQGHDKKHTEGEKGHPE